MKYLNPIKKNTLSNLLMLLIAVTLFLHSSTAVRAQSMLKEFGGIPTDFIIATDSLTFNVKSQVIVKRAVSDFESRTGNEGSGNEGGYGYGYGYGYQSWHLEFTTTGKIVEYYRRNNRARLSYDLTLSDADKDILLKIRLSAKEFRTVSNNKGLYTYSAELKKIPVVLLDKTRYIHIIRIANFIRR